MLMNENILQISDRIKFKTKCDLIMIHLYIKGKEFDISLSEGVRHMLYILYELGGISSKEDYIKFKKLCTQNTSLKSSDTVRNELSRLCTLGILIKKGIHQKYINTDWLPELNDKYIALDYKFINES